MVKADTLAQKTYDAAKLADSMGASDVAETMRTAGDEVLELARLAREVGEDI